VAAEGGLGAKVNVLNYNGQTPLFSAVREANMEIIRILIEEGEADADMNGGEMIKDDSDEALNEEEAESQEEKNFIEAYKNCMTPLQLACILGQDNIALYLIERAQANPNLQTNIKGYACLHLSVLANKPEMVIELLTRTNSNPNLPDYSGRTLIEMVEKYIPYYVENFTSCNYY
jgi:ankyrin repeat protein